jgi:hypothetical protein
MNTHMKSYTPVVLNSGGKDAKKGKLLVNNATINDKIKFTLD